MSDMPQPSSATPSHPIDKARHPAADALAMFVKNRPATLALFVLALIIIAGIAGPIFYVTDPYDMVWAPFSPPGEEGFLFGTDYLGRDILAGILHGTRVSLLVGLSAALMTVFIGVTIGALAGFFRGWVEEILMRITEFFQVLPTLLFSMVIVALFGPTLPVITIAIGAVSWPAVARITRAEFLRIRELEYVTASRASGARNAKLMFKVSVLIVPTFLMPVTPSRFQVLLYLLPFYACHW